MINKFYKNSGLLTLIFIAAVVFSCKEITTVLPSPSITLNSVKQISFKSFEIEIGFNPGEGQALKNIELELENLTILNSPVITERIDLTGFSGSTVIKHIFNAEQINHDFKIKAILNTDKYQYQSQSVVYRSLKNNFYFNIEKDPAYNYDLNPEIAVQLNRGGKFQLLIDYLNPVNEKVTVKLNRTILCENEIDFTQYLFTNNIIQTAGNVVVPEDIQPGDYTVYISIGGLEYVCDKKIRILAGEWKVFNENYPGDKMGDYAWFRIENLLFTVGGNYNSSTVSVSPVWCLDLGSGKWIQKNNFKWPPEQAPYVKRIFASQLSYNNKGYVLTQTDLREVELWQYDELNDLWLKVTDYPGTGADLMICFNIGKKVFVGGGVKSELNNDHNVYDFWSFDLESGLWNKMKDFPVRQKELWRPNTCCSHNEKGYVLEFPEKLWEYNPTDDSWIVKTSFPGPFREQARIIGHQENIYLIGGYHSYLGNTSYKDCWQYSFSNGSWTQRAFMPVFTNHNIAFSYGNSIIIGMGYAHHGYGYFDDHKIYRFTL